MTFNGRRPLMKDNIHWKMHSYEKILEGNIQWKTTFDGRQPLMEDNIQWKTTFDRRRPSMEQWKATFNGR